MPGDPFLSKDSERGSVGGYLDLRDAARRRLLRFTRRAYAELGLTGRPRLLDLGCGTGIPTLELARLSGERVVAVDLDLAALLQLRERICAERLACRISIVQASLRDLDLSPGSFDVIWCEGAVAALGFAASIRRWRPWLAPGGALVLHDERAGLDAKLRQAATAGYRVLDVFELPPKVWLEEYFEPLASRLRELGEYGAGDPGTLAAAEAELARFSSDPESCASAFLVMRRA